MPWDLVQNHIAVVIPVPKDKRSVFVVPWDGFTYIGTTDTDYDGPLDDPQCTPEDIDYLLSAINSSTTTEITRADITGTWAGLRPLVKNSSSGRTADLSRRHRVSPSASGVITITGGKLTTYREMAADTVDRVLSELGEGVEGHTTRRSRTKNLRLRGADGYRSVLDRADAEASTGPLDRAAVEHLANRFGGDARTILAMVDGDPALGEPLVPGLPYLRAEAVYAARYEMALGVDDVLSRRTRARLLARDASAAAADDVAALIAPELGPLRRRAGGPGRGLPGRRRRGARQRRPRPFPRRRSHPRPDFRSPRRRVAGSFHRPWLPLSPGPGAPTAAHRARRRRRRRDVPARAPRPSSWTAPS